MIFRAPVLCAKTRDSSQLMIANDGELRDRRFFATPLCTSLRFSKSVQKFLTSFTGQGFVTHLMSFIQKIVFLVRKPLINGPPFLHVFFNVEPHSEFFTDTDHTCLQRVGARRSKTLLTVKRARGTAPPGLAM